MVVRNSKIGKLQQNQKCTNGANKEKGLFLKISDSSILVRTAVLTYLNVSLYTQFFKVDNMAADFSVSADLIFDMSAFSRLSFNQVNVYNTRRIAFDNYDGKRVFLSDVKLPSASDVPCARADQGKIEFKC
jgi:hypothetical protein